jgi:hypothetical protein
MEIECEKNKNMVDSTQLSHSGKGMTKNASNAVNIFLQLVCKGF